MPTKRRKKNAKLKRRRPSGAAAPQVNPRRALSRAGEAFYGAGDVDEARRLLEELENRCPLSDEAMELYLDVLYAEGDRAHYARIATKMAERYPRDPDAVLMAASGAFATAQPMSAILYFERFLELAPKHPAAADAKERVAKLREHLPELLDSWIDHLPKELPRIASVEKILHVFGLGRFAETIKRSESHLQRYPDDLRVRNNLAEALALSGNDQRALTVFNETLEMAPDNFFAHAARSRVLYFQTRFAESDADAEALTKLQPKQITDLTKAAQTFAYRGEDERIAWAYEQAKLRDWVDEHLNSAVLLHLRATSAARLGDLTTARRLWKAADKIAGPATLAAVNLEDLRQPRGERVGPCFFDITDWLRPAQQQEISEFGRTDGEAELAADAFGAAISRIREQNPNIETLLPDILDRSDQSGQTFAVMLGLLSDKPEVKEALLSFVQGTRGTDAMRQQAAGLMNQRGQLPAPQLSIYVRGRITQVEFFNFEITDEPTVPPDRTEEVDCLLTDAYDALQRGDGIEAEALLREVQTREPDAPDVLNNLAMALQLQDRLVEADALIDEIIEKHTDYFFGRLAAANRLTNQNRYEEALKILVPLQRQQQLHRTEFIGLAKSMINALVGKREFAGAERWLTMLQDYTPDHPEIDQLKLMVERQRRRRGLRSLLSAF